MSDSSRRRVIMSPEKLPLELVEQILYRLPPISLARFRIVCKRWNALFKEDLFVRNHLAHVRPQFFLGTNSKFYSLEITNLDDDDDPSIEVHNLKLCYDHQRQARVHFSCNGIFLCASMDDEIAIWNPWLNQTRWTEPIKGFCKFFGLGYDASKPNKEYKVLVFRYCYRHKGFVKSAIYEFELNAWKDLEHGLLDWRFGEFATIHSFNGTLYWLATSVGSRESFIQSFDFSDERFKPFCSLLPCESDDVRSIQVLSIFRGDRFSLLEQCGATRKIKIWVTKNKISGTEEEEAVSWSLLMTVSIANFPRLGHGVLASPSYFIDNNDDKRLIVCVCDENGLPCVYVVKGNAFKRIQIHHVTDLWPYHLACLPGLVPIPSDQEENKI